MAPTNSRSQEHSNAPSLLDPLLRVQQVKQRITIAATALQAAQSGTEAPNPENWLAKLNRLQPFEVDLALLPIGWGNEQKGPMLEGWQHHGGFTVVLLQQHRRIRSVGARTGLLTGPLLAVGKCIETPIKTG